MGPPPWSLRKTDAHDCIMVPDSDESTAYKFAGRNYARARREAPLGIAALTKPPCNEKLCPSTVRSKQGETKANYGLTSIAPYKCRPLAFRDRDRIRRR